MSVALVNKRRGLGLTQIEMAKRAGVSKMLIVRLENGRLSDAAYTSSLRKLADGYGVPISDIQAACAPATTADSLTAA